MSAASVPDSPAMKALHRATWFLLHEGNARAAAGDKAGAEALWNALPFLAEAKAEFMKPVEAWPKTAAPSPRCIWPDCGHDTNCVGYSPGCTGIGCPTVAAPAAQVAEGGNDDGNR